MKDYGHSKHTKKTKDGSHWEAGAMPRAQLFQPEDKWIEYSDEWKALAREWYRPAAMRAAHSK